jgi:hypothetical protein
MKGFCHADIHALGMTAAQITFGCRLLNVIDMNTAKRTGFHTQPAPDTKAFVNDHGAGQRIPGDGSGWTCRHALGHFTLVTGGCDNTAFFHINMNKDVGTMAIVRFQLVKKTDPLTAPAGNAAGDFNTYNIHKKP